eukprot:CAMPEP_0179902872 /NCGR_PEP_ID=MMETSP0982-20121206/40865_1 /TAXON_ID=483367 /ORGANISM="non described non described, Strain CCMP 2436" /LENGTH=89 /DNA_ID=CAMNT_0021802187 /DNA_START=480 /DNA_END=750 /DNA_ORIENTATION=+
MVAQAFRAAPPNIRPRACRDSQGRLMDLAGGHRNKDVIVDARLPQLAGAHALEEFVRALACFATFVNRDGDGRYDEGCIRWVQDAPWML